MWSLACKNLVQNFVPLQRQVNHVIESHIKVKWIGRVLKGLIKVGGHIIWVAIYACFIG